MMAVLQNASIYIVSFLLVITVIVTIHELGHFLTARAFGVAVDRFSIGFGPTLWARRDKSGVEWRVAALPLGGYVRFAGDDNAASIPDGDDLEAMRAQIVAREGPGAELKYLHFKPLWQRALIVAAGPFANFALTIVLLTGFFLAFGNIVTAPRIDGVEAGSPAAAAGMRTGDVITAIDGHDMSSFEDIRAYVAYRPNVQMSVDLLRDGRSLSVDIRPRTDQIDSVQGGKQPVGRLGVKTPASAVVWLNPLEAVGLATRKTWDTAGTTIFVMGRLITGQVNPNQLSGFLGIAHATGAITTQAVSDASKSHVPVLTSVAFSLIQVIALLSVSVGLLNLMPVPVLDGGHLVFYAYEAIARRPLSAGIQAIGYRVGLALLLGLMLFAGWNDLQRLRVFHFLGGLIS